MNDQAIEQEIQAKGLTATRITPADIEATIQSEEFVVFGTLTICVLGLRNGFQVTGESACVNPANFNAEFGQKLARQKAVDKIWALEGYLLAERLLTTLRSTPPPGAAPHLVPGVMCCAKCSFRLMRTNLHVYSGGFSAGDNKTEPCPNGCGPLWPVTWEQRAREAEQFAAVWHRLVESIATILEVNCNGSAEEVGNAIANKIRATPPPGDVDARLGALASTLRDLKAGIADQATDVVWYSPIQTACDRIEEIVAALTTPTKESARIDFAYVCPPCKAAGVDCPHTAPETGESL